MFAWIDVFEGSHERINLFVSLGTPNESLYVIKLPVLELGWGGQTEFLELMRISPKNLTLLFIIVLVSKF